MKNTHISLLALLFIIGSSQLSFGMGKNQDDFSPVSGLKDKVREISYRESDYSKAYDAKLHNGDSISATFFVKGPMAGQYSCMLMHTRNGMRLQKPLSSTTFRQLERLYNNQEDV